MVNSKSKLLTVERFNTGLNVVDDSLLLQDSDLIVADDVKFNQSGEVASINPPLQVGEDILVNGKDATKFLGIRAFNGYIYAMISNGTEARLMRSNGASGTGGNWTQANATNFDRDALVDFIVYADKLWFVNGKTTGTSVLNFLDTSNNLTGLTAAGCGLPATLNHIQIHLERIWISDGGNTLYVTKQYPTGVDADWNASAVYTGANTAGCITIDDNSDDYIQGLETLFSQLIIYRRYSIFLVTGTAILASTITKKTNSRNGVLAARSIAKADNVVYFLSDDGVKIFNGTTIQEQTTQLDTLITLTYDRPIASYLSAISNADRALMAGISYKDKYYISDSDSETIFVLDELATALNPKGQQAWSRWITHPAEVFLEFNGSLYCAKENKAYIVEGDGAGDITTQMRTKDYTVGDNLFNKIFESLKITFRTGARPSSVVLKWYLNGSSVESGSVTLPISGRGVVFNAGHKYDAGIRYNSVSISFTEYTKRKLLSGRSISFALKAEGTNRFQLSSFNLIYEPTRRGG